MINGVPRFGTLVAHDPSRRSGERVSIGGRQRMLFMKQESADEVVSGISLGQAKRTLVDALRRLPELARDLESNRSGPARAMTDRLARSGPPIWFLALDELESTGSELRHRLPGAQGGVSGPRLGTAPRAPSRCRSSSAR